MHLGARVLEDGLGREPCLLGARGALLFSPQKAPYLPLPQVQELRPRLQGQEHQHPLQGQELQHPLQGQEHQREARRQPLWEMGEWGDGGRQETGPFGGVLPRKLSQAPREGAQSYVGPLSPSSALYTAARFS